MYLYPHSPNGNMLQNQDQDIDTHTVSQDIQHFSHMDPLCCLLLQTVFPILVLICETPQPRICSPFLCFLFQECYTMESYSITFWYGLFCFPSKFPGDSQSCCILKSVLFVYLFHFLFCNAE